MSEPIIVLIPEVAVLCETVKSLYEMIYPRNQDTVLNNTYKGIAGKKRKYPFKDTTNKNVKRARLC